MRKMIMSAVAAIAVAAAPVSAQSIFLEARGGAVLPTGEIGDVIKAGGSFGGTLGFNLNPSWSLMAEVDVGTHKVKPAEITEITTLHLMGKLGYSLTGDNQQFGYALNAGAGLVSFNPEGPVETNTYFAINVGAKITLGLTPAFAIVLSPQGNIAFSDEDELGAGNAWVWPFTAGLRIRF